MSYVAYEGRGAQDRCRLSLRACDWCVIGMRVLGTCKIPGDEFLLDFLRGSLVVSKPPAHCNKNSGVPFFFHRCFSETVDKLCVAVKVLAHKSDGAVAYVWLSGSSTGWGLGMMRSTVRYSTRGLRWMIALRADKSRCLYGPSVT